ncbi:hypothetical protein PVK06_030694 [Gossypium arboreum]|uniref:RNase H type-1 domain-containing protein n=1 Tax=Gossypium arboreum TaxID=29729 RepID=A0ABR0NNZ2_GOSAR|nr:hypothetical protein PVK06_030694 [Gossypium arboreum]
MGFRNLSQFNIALLAKQEVRSLPILYMEEHMVCDVAAFGGFGMAGIVIRDSRSRILVETITVNDNLPSAFVAEAFECLQALRMVADLGFSRVVVECDSLCVINKANLSGVNRSTIGTFIYNIKMEQ